MVLLGGEKTVEQEQEIVLTKTETEADSVRISPEVIGIVAGIAASEVAGIAGMSAGLVGGIAEKLGRKDLSKGIKVHQDEEKIRLEINIIIEYGAKIPEITRALRDSVRRSVENTTGLEVTAINIHVQGLYLPREEKKDEVPLPAEE